MCHQSSHVLNAWNVLRLKRDAKIPTHASRGSNARDGHPPHTSLLPVSEVGPVDCVARRIPICDKQDRHDAPKTKQRPVCMTHKGTPSGRQVAIAAAVTKTAVAHCLKARGALGPVRGHMERIRFADDAVRNSVTRKMRTKACENEGIPAKRLRRKTTPRISLDQVEK